MRLRRGKNDGSEDVTATALRMCARELECYRMYHYEPLINLAPEEEDVDDIVEEFLEKARGFPPEG